MKANPDFFTHKLQNCTNNKVHPNLIHANKLRLCDTKRDRFYSKIAVQFDVKTNMDGNTISKTATDSFMETSHKQADITNPLTLPLQTADNTAAATTVPAAPKTERRRSEKAAPQAAYILSQQSKRHFSDCSYGTMCYKWHAGASAN